MAQLSNSPRSRLVVRAEQRKPLALLVEVVKLDGTPVDLTGASLRLVVAQPKRKGGTTLLTQLATLVDAPGGLMRLDIQGTALDFAADEYPFSLALVSAESYASLIAKGVFNLLDNVDTGVEEYTGDPAASQLTLKLTGPQTMRVKVNHVPDAQLSAAVAQAEVAQLAAAASAGEAGTAALAAADAAVAAGSYRTLAEESAVDAQAARDAAELAVVEAANVISGDYTLQAQLAVNAAVSGSLAPSMTTAEIATIPPAERWLGRMIYASDTDLVWTWNGTEWRVTASAQGSPEPYTPTLDGFWDVGAGSLAGNYRHLGGGLISWDVEVVFSGAISTSTGGLVISLPFGAPVIGIPAATFGKPYDPVPGAWPYEETWVGHAEATTVGGTGAVLVAAVDAAGKVVGIDATLDIPFDWSDGRDSVIRASGLSQI